MSHRLVSCVLVGIAIATWPVRTAAQDAGVTDCRHLVRSARVQAGQPFLWTFGDDLVFRLDPETHPANPQGWTIRVTPAADPGADYSMVVTPPYRFWNPRYLDTGYGVSAQEALLRTPRDFSFVATDEAYRTARAALDVLLWSGTHTDAEIDAAEAAMESLRSYTGLFAIEDGSATAATAADAYGRIEWVAFTIDLCLP